MSPILGSLGHSLLLACLQILLVAGTKAQLVDRPDQSPSPKVGGPTSHKEAEYEVRAASRARETSARLTRIGDPRSVAVDTAGSLFIADAAAQGIWRVDSAGSLSLLGCKKAVSDANRDPGKADDRRIAAASLAVDPRGYLVAIDSARNRVCYVDAEAGITVLAGSGQVGFAGDRGPATEAMLSAPSGVAVDSAGNVFIADSGNQRIRRVEAATGLISTFAGTGASGFSGDGGPATQARLTTPQGLAVDGEDNLWIADSGNNRIRRVDASSGVIDTVAGNGGLGFAGDGGPAVKASLGRPAAVAVDDAGDLFIADADNQRVRRVDSATHVITTVAGNGSSGYSRDGELATEVALSHPRGVAVGVEGDLYIAESEGHRVRRVDHQTGVITTVAGNGAGAGAGLEQPPVADAGPDRVVECTSPEGAFVDLDGSASFGSGDAPLAFTWSGPFLKPRAPATGVDPKVFLPLGKSALRLVVNDGQLASEPSLSTVEVTVTIEPGPVLSGMVPEGSPVPLSRQAWPRGAVLPLELRLFCGRQALGEKDSAPPRIVALAGDRGPLVLDSLRAPQGRADPSGLPFQFNGASWVYDLNTAPLETGTYLVTILLPDGRRLSAGFVLR